MPVNFNRNTKVKVNGREYNSIEEMPPDVRSVYEKAIASLPGSAAMPPVNTYSQITFNGQTFNNPDEMPEDVRRIYDSVMSAVDKNGDGLPDSIQAEEEPTFASSAPIISAQVEEAPSRTNYIVVIVALLGLLFVLIGVVLFVLSSR